MISREKHEEYKRKSRLLALTRSNMISKMTAGVNYDKEEELVLSLRKELSLMDREIGNYCSGRGSYNKKFNG